MNIEKMEALEARVRKLVDLIQELKRTNALLEEDLKMARERLDKREALTQSWDAERSDIRTRIEKVLGELDFVDRAEKTLQEVSHDQDH